MNNSQADCDDEGSIFVAT